MKFSKCVFCGARISLSLIDIQTINRQFDIKMYGMFTVGSTIILMRNEIHRVSGQAFSQLQLVNKRLHLYDTAYIESARQNYLFCLIFCFVIFRERINCLLENIICSKTAEIDQFLYEKYTKYCCP
jgi:hypothetical protein